MKPAVVYKKLVCYGLFPEKLKGMFSAKEFGEWIIKHKINVSSDYYNLVIYKATRNDNAPRVFGIPNPAAYVNICREIRDNWNDIDKIYKSVKNYDNISMIIPKDGNKNHRLVSFAPYDKNRNRELLDTKKQFGKKYLAYADISNFYHSIYTHSIPWAIVGKTKSRNNTSMAAWYNRIDRSFRNAQHKETKGIPIGPDISGIVAEIILSRIDKKLSVKYEYSRFIDDYHCFCETREKAEQFIKDLAIQLDEYKLSLNTGKTKILSLPRALNESWVRKLKAAIAWKEIGKKQKDMVISFLDLSSELFMENPRESPIRYAIQVIRKKKYTDYETFHIVFQYYLNLCFLYPYIVDICHEFLYTGLKSFPPKNKEILKEANIFLNKFIKEHISYKRTDAVSWSFYNAIIFGLKIDNFDLRCKQVKGDCVSTLMLYLYAKSNKISISYFEKYYLEIEKMAYRDFCVGKKGDYSEMWLFVYEFSRLENKILSIDLLERLRKDDVSFLEYNILSKI